MTTSTHDYGTVTYEGVTYTLTQDAYVSNYGTNDGVAYYASAVDAAGTEYKVTWLTTAEYDAANERVQAAYKADQDPDYADLSLVEDESNACDCDTPYDVAEA